MGRPIVRDYVSDKRLWVEEVIGNDAINHCEYVQRVITMGKFLESKAIERIPNNP